MSAELARAHGARRGEPAPTHASPCTTVVSSAAPGVAKGTMMEERSTSRNAASGVPALPEVGSPEEPDYQELSRMGQGTFNSSASGFGGSASECCCAMR